MRELSLRKKRRSVQHDLTAWCRHIGFEPAAHHLLIISEINALLASDSYDTLLIGAPPGSAKSSYVSIAFPSWYISRFPQNSILHASHTTTLAEKWGRRIRNTVEQHSDVLGVTLSPDNKAAARWSVTAGGEYYAVGAGVGIAGFRADCVTGDTIIDTNFGLKRIDSIESLIGSCYVLSYEGQARKPVYRRVLAIARRTAHELWRVRTASGRVVEATGEHRFYTERGWRSASSLSVGDVLLRSVPSARAPAGCGSCKESPAAAVLQQDVLDKDDKRSSRLGGAPNLQCLRGGVTGEAARGACLLEGMLERHCKNAEQHSDKPSEHSVVHCLHEGFSPEQQYSAGSLLLSRLQRCGSFKADERSGQSKLAGWVCSESLLGRKRQEIQGGETSGSEERHLLRSVYERPSIGRPSHRRGQYEQQAGEHRYPVSGMPHSMAYGREAEAVKDTVALVERVRESGDRSVYDIQVEGTACFFANGVLVHNCGIIDDPYGSREDADSETIREKVQEWFMADFSARLKPGAKRIVMATRWREDDLTGWIEEQAKKGKYNIRTLMLPAIAGANDPLGRKSGEYLWDEPGGYNYGSFLRARQKEMQPRDWSALYQQAPAPDEGLYFKREWFKTYDELPKQLRFYGASDYAVTADGGDFTVHGIAGVDADDNLYIADVWRHQTESNVWVDAFCDLVRKWKPLYWAEEQGQILKSLGPFIAKRILETRSYCAREQFTSVSDKPTRARSFQARAAMGKVYLPSNAPWVADFLKELLSFPAGVHDDQVDMLGLLGRLLDKMVGLSTPKPAEPDPMADYRSNDRTNAGDSWKWG